MQPCSSSPLALLLFPLALLLFGGKSLLLLPLLLPLLLQLQPSSLLLVADSGQRCGSTPPLLNGYWLVDVHVFIGGVVGCLHALGCLLFVLPAEVLKVFNLGL